MHGSKTPPETDDTAEVERKAYHEMLDREVDALSWLKGSEYDLTCKDVASRFDLNLKTLKAMVSKVQRKRSAEAKRANAATKEGGALTIDAFVAYMPMHNYIYLPNRDPWPAASVNARVPPIEVNGGTDISASEWLDQNRPIEQMTWMPGEPALIKDTLFVDGGRVHAKGATTLNLYRPPTVVGIPGDVEPWLKLGYSIYPDDFDHILLWLAHRVQQPAVKLNHAVLLGGSPGIGKDTLLVPVRHAVGPWNFADINPQNLLEKWNPYARSVILCISEVHDLGDTNRYAFYERSKRYIVDPPSVLRVEEKNLRQHYIQNLCGVIYTTNHKTDGLYLPSDDRRNYVAWSPLPENPRSVKYWNALNAWYECGGIENVVHYLRTLDISSFNSKAPPKKTEAFWEIVNASTNPDDTELAGALEELGEDAVTLTMLAGSSIGRSLGERANRARIPHRMQACKYVAVRSNAKDGYWVVHGVRQAVYAREALTIAERFNAAHELVRRKSKSK
ncbi:primase-helicase family protein [Mesorhizobium shangrilense]|uniref:Primase-helicase family protein n=1 Tax=Mesorhizobium shangrilense TaxID=460060 RepID=A0ABV2D731_9HYPH